METNGKPTNDSPTDQPLKLLLTPREAAEALSISERTLWTLTNDREIPVVRIGKRSVRYSPAALQEWIDRQQNPTASLSIGRASG